MKFLLENMRWIGSRMTTAAASATVWLVLAMAEDDAPDSPSITIVDDSGNAIDLIVRG